MESQGQHLPLNEFLDTHELDSKKWVPNFLKVKVTKPNQILAIKGSRDHFEALSANATEQEKKILRQLLGVHAPWDNHTLELQNELCRADLDQKHWLPILKKQLGVMSPQGLRLIGSESYGDLIRFSQESCEKEALQSLLGILIDKYEREKQKGKLQERHEWSKDMLQQLKEAGKRRHEEVIQQLESGIREALQISADSWISQDATLETVTDHLETYIDKVNGISEDLSDFSLLQHASEGLALQGILLGKNLEDQLCVREKLLKAPNDIKLMRPLLSYCDKTKEFSHKSQEDQFTRSMDTLGYSVSSPFNLGLGFQCLSEVSLTQCNKAHNEVETTADQQEDLYCSTIEYSFVPLASCYFSDSQLQLSQDAVRDLQEIEKLITSKLPGNAVQNECEKFFHKYGSHANKGHLHFGGIYWQKTYSQGFQEQDLDAVKELQREALCIKASLSHDSFVTCMEVSLRVFKGNKSSLTLASRTFLSVAVTGGPPDVSYLPLWKTCLVASNSTWSLIDRGTNTVPVWEIIQMNHIKEFQNPEILVKSLKQAWQQMTKVFLESSPAQQEEDHISDLEAIKSWNEGKDMSQCLHHLTYLHAAKRRVIRRTKSLQAWPDLYLSKTPLQNYLKSIMMEVKKCSEQNKLEEVTPIMKQLLRPAKPHLVKDLADIYHWLYNTEQVEAQGYTDYLSLKAILHDILEEMEVVKVKSDLASAEQQDVGIKATTIVAQAVHFMFRNLSQAKYEQLFLTTLLFPFKCDANENNFLRLLSIQDLKYLYRMLDEQSEEFCKMVPSSLPMQSYLFHLAVKIYNSEMVNLEITEIQIKGHLEYIQMEIQNELDPQVRQVLSQFYTDTDWKLLQSELEFLVSGFPGLQIQEDTGLGLIDLLSAVPVSEASKVTGTQVLLQACDNIQDLFRMLGLDKKYTQKFTLQDALIIRQEMQVNAKCTELEQLPLFILQKIMMHDYQSRTILFHHPNVQRKSGTDTDSDEDDSDTNSESDLVTSNGQPLTVHPMDALLALFHCSDSFLRQDLMMRLSTCQIAIPLLLPDPFTQTLTLSLWAMRSIVKEWKCANPNVGEATSYECPIVDHPTPVVSFFRFSRSKLSKSKILNCVISNNLHYYFFNIDCEGGSTKSLLMDGLVELCWFLPAGKPNDPFPKVITFLNLRGDARQHTKQMKFLNRVSFMKFVLLSETDLNETGIEVLQELAKPPGELVLMFSKGKKRALKLLQETLSRKQYKFSAMKLSKQGLADIKTSIRAKINHNLSELCFNKKLSDYPEIAHMQDIEISVDEDDSDCAQGRKLASEIQRKITESSFKGKSKDDILPLQGRKLWHEWARHDKEQHRHLERGSKGVEQYNSEREDEKRRIRTTQLLRVERGKLVIHTFVLHLLNHTGDTRRYFLQWLKIFLDDISREKFFNLQSQYQAQKRQFHQQRKQNRTGREDLEKPTMPTEIDDSIGLEHFLRELGQMYEAVVQQEKVSPELRSNVSCLPRVAAELLSSGYPLELLDGSASYVPLKWVCAVLGELRGLLGDSHLLVLSVLGAQSSGKSTLLNTMFGLQFMVSAGRCTRGAFIQLVPLGETMKTRVNCEYLLVIDTEGLHSPEQTSLETQKHNNELATFVIGLANVTLVNIFGEAPGEMENVLQTAVHAFIRMKNVQLQPSCQFVHQNVAAMMASDKGMAGREAFHKKLDYLTKIATVEEQCEDLYAVFNDVIEFDDDKDVWQFPNLWVGDPPMAPVNPGYSEKALALKSRLIDVVERGGVQCSLSTFETRIINLWKAVLYENFVFSFKNALEITVYNSLDAKYAEWSWEFQLTMLEWEQQAENMIGSTDIQELDNLQITKELPSHVEKIYTDLSEKMGIFFEEHEQRDTLVQWKRQTELRLNDLRREQHTLAKSQCKMLIASRKALAKVEAIRARHVNELLYDVLELVPHQEEKLLSDSELEKKFDQKWMEWIENFDDAQSYQGGCQDIEGSLEGCLRELLRPHGYNVIPKLSSESLKSRAHITLGLKVIEETHISVKAKKMSLPLKTAQEATDIILYKSQCYLEKKQRQNFNQSFCHELLKDLLQAIADAQKEIPFTPEYKVDMALTVCGYALTKFEEMAEEFREKNDPIKYLEREIKTPLLRIFISRYKQSSKEKTAAAVFCDLLAKPIENAVIGSLCHKIADNMRKSGNCFSTKRALKGKVLCELAEKGSFEDYVAYLNNVRHSLQLWIKQYTVQYCEQDEGGKSKLVVFAEEELKLLVHRISDAARQVTNALTIDTEQDIGRWLNDFHCKLKKKLPLDLREIQKLVGAAKLTDFQIFTKELCNGLAGLHVTEFMISVDHWNKQPCDIVSDALMGCCEQCPFCKEQCELTDPHHPGKHFIELHRPVCLGGIKFSYSRELVLDVCNSLVGSTKLFVNAATKWKYHRYKRHYEIYPDWQIRPENSRYASSYWKWFVAAYISQIVEQFAAERTKIPKDWRNLTREEVVEDLKHIYN